MDWSIKHIEQLKQKGLIRDYTVTDLKAKKEERLPRKSKYKNKRTGFEDPLTGELIVFDSAKECERYKHLLFLLKIGEIAFLRRQVEYELNPGGTHSLKYIADFEYITVRTGVKVTEDTKGFRTREYQRKKKLLFKVHGIKIFET